MIRPRAGHLKSFEPDIVDMFSYAVVFLDAPEKQPPSALIPHVDDVSTLDATGGGGPSEGSL